MSSNNFHRKKRHRKEYIPEEKYDVDGTLVRNEDAFKKKRWDLKEIVSVSKLLCRWQVIYQYVSKIHSPEKYREAMEEAQKYMKTQRGTEFLDLGEEDSDRPWTEESDRLFFSRRERGMVSWMIPTGSPIYYEFEGKEFSLSLINQLDSLICKLGFFIKLKDSINKGKSKTRAKKLSRMDVVRKEGELLRHSLTLFQNFQSKKTANMREKIEENRAALPVTPFASAIVQTLRKHRVLLIAGDTGCGKSTQGSFSLVRNYMSKRWILNCLISTSDFNESGI